MSTQKPSPPGLRIPQSTLVFVILVLALGALVLSSNSIDQRATVRAEFTLTPSITPTPVDPFQSQEYIPWRSPNGLIGFERPRLWTAQPNPQTGPLDYIVRAEGSSGVGMGIFIRPLSALGVPSLPAAVKPEELLKRYLETPSSVAGQPTPTPLPAGAIRSAQVAGLQGALFHQRDTALDPISGNPVDYESDLYFLMLDANNLIIINGVSPAADWSKMQGIVDRLIKTFQVDAPGTVRALSSVSGAPASTAAPTGAATANSTPAASPPATRNP